MRKNNDREILQRDTALLSGVLLLLTGCASPEIHRPIVPSAEYSRYIKAQMGVDPRLSESTRMGSSRMAPPPQVAPAGFQSTGQPQVRYVDGDYRDQLNRSPSPQLPSAPEDYREYREERSAGGGGRAYSGPLAYGDPGVTSSLWRESRGENELFRDHRAFQPMDLITIVVSEKSEGKGDASTETSSETELEASAENLLGLEKYLTRANKNIDLASLLKATTTNDFKGDGKTNRKASLTATISAMVIEVLPSGILRIEGEKIIAVNNEEQTMVISGLVRPRDVTSENSIDSSKLANLRIDYYGKGVIGEAQYGGWLGRMLRVVWPF
jgi:flagellar L-ring protein precursor FlgH